MVPKEAVFDVSITTPIICIISTVSPTLKKEGCAFTSTVLLDAIKAQFNHVGIPMNDISIVAEAVTDAIPDKDPSNNLY